MEESGAPGHPAPVSLPPSHSRGRLAILPWRRRQALLQPVRLHCGVGAVKGKLLAASTEEAASLKGKQAEGPEKLTLGFLHAPPLIHGRATPSVEPRATVFLRKPQRQDFPQVSVPSWGGGRGASCKLAELQGHLATMQSPRRCSATAKEPQAVCSVPVSLHHRPPKHQMTSPSPRAPVQKDIR